MALLGGTIVTLVLLIILTPIYAYGLYQWYLKRATFVIKNRFPIQAIIIIILQYISKVLNITQSILVQSGVIYLTYDGKEVDKIDLPNRLFFALIVGTGYFITVFVFYRGYLVNLRFRVSFLMADKIYIRENQSETNNNKSNRHINVEQYLSSRLFLTYTIVGSIWVGICQIYRDQFTTAIRMIPFILSPLIGIIIIITILKNKVKDELGCVRDIWVSIVVVIFAIIIATAVHKQTGAILQFFGSNMLSLFLMFYPLYLIHKFHGQATPESIPDIGRANAPSVSDVQSVSSKTHSNNAIVVDIVQYIKKPLHKFLKSETNYNVFVNYLALCFATENILFSSEVIIFYHIILKHSQSINEKNSPFYSLTFSYLDTIYNEYQNILMKVDQSNDFELVRPYLWIIARKIYHTYIIENSEYQINISFGDRQELHGVLAIDSNVEKFKSFDDFLNLYHSALMEIWMLMNSCYRYSFKSYVEKQT
eukprot:380001_1